MTPYTLETLVGLLCDSEGGPRLPYNEARRTAMLALDSLGLAFVIDREGVIKLLDLHAPRLPDPQLADTGDD